MKVIKVTLCVNINNTQWELHPVLFVIHETAHGQLPLLDHMTGQKTTIHRLATMLSTSKYVLYLGHNHLLTTGSDDLTF